MRTRIRPFAFAAVGAAGLACQLAVLGLLADAGVPVGVATAAAVGTALVHNFLWHRRWTWRDRAADGAWTSQFVRFAGLNGAVSLAGNVVVTTGLTATGMPLVPANVAAVAVCGVVNFMLADRAVFAAGCILIVAAGSSEAAVLDPETVRAWDAYVRQTEARIAREEPDTGIAPLPPDQWRRLQSGEVLLVRREAPADGIGPDLAGGAVHHWVGRVFLPQTTVASLVAALQGPSWRRWTPAEVRAMQVRREGDGLRVRMRVERDSLVDVTYDIEHRVRFTMHPAGHATSRSVATRVVQVDDPGTPRERARPAGEDYGFLWRLNAYWRYVPVPGGVLVECESLALSRRVPLVMKPLAGPLVERVSRESLGDTLRALRNGFAEPGAGTDTR